MLYLFSIILPKYLMNEMERIQKRVTGVILPDLEYSRVLERPGIDHLDVHHKTPCKSHFKSIKNNENHRLHCLLPPSYDYRIILDSNSKF